jgi:hypothetical protein
MYLHFAKINMKHLFSLIVLILIATSGTFANDDLESKKNLNRKDTPSRTARPDFPGTLSFDVGINFLMNNTDQLSTSVFGSKTANFYYYRHAQFGKSPVSFNAGIGIGLEKYDFSNDVTLNSTFASGIKTVTISQLNSLYGANSEFKKTRLATNYIDIPVEFRYQLGDDPKKGMLIGVGGKVGVMYSAHTKVNYSREGENFSVKRKDFYDMNRLRYGVTGRIGFQGVSAWGYYGLNTLFKDGKGPQGNEANQVTVGLSFSLF